MWCHALTAWWSARPSTSTVATPHLGEYELAECIAGLRPMTPDNLPLVGRLDARTLIAAGHGRSGFLLAPWTAEQIVSELIPVGAHT
jgi:glycine oxidase